MATIMVVDDEEFVDEMIQEHLHRAGFETVAFFNAPDALEFIENNPSSIDLAIIDHIMPGISGTELADKLLMMMPDLPIIIITGSPDYTAFGNYMVLKKPLTRDKLLEAVRGLIG
jgi:DNA-binding NtrC family response regulator